MNPDSHLILQSTPLFNALEKLSSIDDGVMTLLAADADGRLTGTLTDGDIRRALLRGISLQTRVADVMNSSFRRIKRLRSRHRRAASRPPRRNQASAGCRCRRTSLTASRYAVDGVASAAVGNPHGRRPRRTPQTTDPRLPQAAAEGRPARHYRLQHRQTRQKTA